MRFALSYAVLLLVAIRFQQQSNKDILIKQLPELCRHSVFSSLCNGQELLMQKFLVKSVCYTTASVKKQNKKKQEHFPNLAPLRGIPRSKTVASLAVLNALRLHTKTIEFSCGKNRAVLELINTANLTPLCTFSTRN